MDKVFWRRSEWWASIAIPYLGLLVDSLNQLIKNGHLDPSNPLFILMIKGVALLTGIYTLGRSLLKTFGQSTVLPTVVNTNPDGSSITPELG